MKTSNKLWLALLGSLLILLLVLSAQGGSTTKFNLSNPSIVGKTVTPQTGIDSLIGKETTSTTTPEELPSSIKSLLEVVPIVFVAVIILVAVAYIGGVGP